MIDELQGFTETKALTGGKRDLIVAALVIQRLPSPDHAANVDDLFHPRDGAVERHTVKSLDDLGPGGAYAQNASSRRE